MRETAVRATMAILRPRLRQLATEESEHRGGKRRREEPRGGVPQLGVGGEPGLGEGEGNECVPRGGDGAVVQVIRVHKYPSESELRQEVERVEAHDATGDKLGRGLDARARLVLAELRARVRDDVSG